jgi:hypothetical protein
MALIASFRHPRVERRRHFMLALSLLGIAQTQHERREKGRIVAPSGGAAVRLGCRGDIFRGGFSGVLRYPAI